MPGWQWLANLAERKSDGLLLAVYELDPKQIRRIKSLGIPVVLTTRWATGGSA